MKMKRVSVTFEKRVSIIVYAPEDMDDSALREVAEEQATRIDADGWECDWDTYLNVSQKIVTLPEGERTLTEERTPLGYPVKRVAKGGLVDQPAVLVVSDERDNIVNPEDATWWQA